MNLPKTNVAALFHSPNAPLELRETEIPAMRKGNILVEVSLCTICGSDLHTYSGRRKSPSPSILGHEMVGKLVWPEMLIDGRGKEIRVGERIVWSMVTSCNACRYCEWGLPQKCESMQKYGHHAVTPEWPLSGGLSQYCMLVPGTFIVGIPDDVDDALAAPASCATSTVAAAIRKAGDVTGKNVLVIGAGMLGRNACAMLDAAGAGHVMVADTNPIKLRGVSEFGAKSTVDASLPVSKFADAVRELTEGSGADFVFDFAGVNAAVERALASTRIGGTCLLIGSVFPQDPLQIYAEDIVRRLLTIRGVYNYSPEDLLYSIDFLQSHGKRYPFAKLVGEEFALSDVQRAFELAGSAEAPSRVGVRPRG